MLATLALAAATCDPQNETCRRTTSGPGPVLQILLVVVVAGIVLLGWLVLRGYRDQDRFGDQ